MESTWDVRNLLLSFLALLIEPNPDDPANVDAAVKYRRYKGMVGLVFFLYVSQTQINFPFLFSTDHGEPAYLDAIKANVAESRELAKRDNVIVPETIEDYMRSGIQTEEEEPGPSTAKEKDDGAQLTTTMTATQLMINAAADVQDVR
jgi:hypothetical protein